MNIEAYDADSLRKMVRLLEYENKILKDKLKKAGISYEEVNPFEEKRLNHKFCGISDSSRSSVGSYRIASERNIRHQDIRIPVCEES